MFSCWELKRGLLARLAPDVIHGLGGQLSAMCLLDPGPQEIRQGTERLALSHVIEDGGPAQGAVQDIILDALPLEGSDGLELLVFFGGDVDRESGHGQDIA